MRALLLTREYPPEIYGGAGVHVDYLSRELAKLIPVEVRTFGDQDMRAGNLVRSASSTGGFWRWSGARSTLREGTFRWTGA